MRPDTKNKRGLKALSYFFLPRKGLERAAPVRTLVQKLRAGEQFLARGRVHSRQTHSVGMLAACYLLPVYTALRAAGERIATPVCALARNDRGRMMVRGSGRFVNRPYEGCGMQAYGPRNDKAGAGERLLTKD